ncbi:MAG: succinate dehydrogenase assembly factor 2 [Pseudomonadota bacterium]
MDDLLSAQDFSKLRWRCRRGLLENDLFIERFFNQFSGRLTEGQARGLYVLMDLADNDLLDLFLARKEPEGELCVPEVQEVLRQIRRPPPPSEANR